MKCPRCGEKMESDAFQEVKAIARPSRESPDGTIFPGKNGELGPNQYYYRCENCDSEWVGRRREKLTMIDGGDIIPLSNTFTTSVRYR